MKRKIDIVIYDSEKQNGIYSLNNLENCFICGLTKKGVAWYYAQTTGRTKLYKTIDEAYDEINKRKRKEQKLKNKK